MLFNGDDEAQLTDETTIYVNVCVFDFDSNNFKCNVRFEFSFVVVCSFMQILKQ